MWRGGDGKYLPQLVLLQLFLALGDVGEVGSHPDPTSEKAVPSFADLEQIIKQWNIEVPDADLLTLPQWLAFGVQPLVS